MPADKQIAHHPGHSEKSAYYRSFWKSAYYPSSKFQPEILQRFELNMGVCYILRKLKYHLNNPNQIQGNFPNLLITPAWGVYFHQSCLKQLEYFSLYRSPVVVDQSLIYQDLEETLLLRFFKKKKNEVLLSCG